MDASRTASSWSARNPPRPLNQLADRAEAGTSQNTTQATNSSSVATSGMAGWRNCGPPGDPGDQGPALASAPEVLSPFGIELCNCAALASLLICRREQIIGQYTSSSTVQPFSPLLMLKHEVLSIYKGKCLTCTCVLAHGMGIQPSNRKPSSQNQCMIAKGILLCQTCLRGSISTRGGRQGHSFTAQRREQSHSGNIGTKEMAPSHQTSLPGSPA